jgi:putative ABC transport system substrate-binding protein
MHHVKRREFMGLLGSAAAAWPLVTFAQSPERMRRIGVVMAYAEDDPNGQIQVEAFREYLASLGWVERTNVTIDVRYARGNPARARELATDLLRQQLDLMVSNSNLVTTILQTEAHNPTGIHICLRSCGQRLRQGAGETRRQHYRLCQFPAYHG